MSLWGNILSHPGLLGSYGTPFVPHEFTGTGGKIFWVGNRSGLPSGDGSKPEYPFSTVEKAFAKCSSGRNDVVYVLPGHAQTISAADAWAAIVAGTKVIGLGTGTDRPTFTYSASTSTILIAVANVRIQNCRFLTAGPLSSTTALTTVLGFGISAAGFQFIANECNCAVDTDQLTTTFMTLSAAADDCTIARNTIIGGTTGTITGVLVTTGAVDRLKIDNNYIAACATTQLLDLSNAASIDTLITNNVMQNKLDTTTAVIAPHATSTGFVHNNIWGTAAAGTAPASSGFTTYTTTLWFGINQAITVSGKSALLSPAVDS